MLSEHGAHIRCNPELAVGESGSLNIPGVADTIAFVLRGCSAMSLSQLV
jgi:hypothetical protein